MEVKNIKITEADRVLDMYKEYRITNKINSVFDFCKSYLSRCQCCNEIQYKEDLEDTKNWDGKILNVCKECKKVMVEDIKTIGEQMDIDDIDGVIDDMRLGMI